MTRIIDIEGPVFPKRVNRRWPAIILAANRTARVPGRIIFLIVSIQTINGIRTAGVPWGTRCANICWVWLIQPYNINLIQRGRARASVRVKWLVLVKIYGNRPKKLLNKIIENRDTKMNVLPLWFESFNRVLNSLWRVNKILFQIMLYRDGIIQYIDGIISNPINVLSQFNERLKILEEGSNTENKLVIIFS